MSEKPAEGNQLPDEGVAPATPLPGNVQPLQGNVSDAVMKRLDALEAQNRGLQKGIDKRMDRDVMPTIQKLAKYLGVTEEQVVAAQRNAKLDELVANDLATPPQPISTARSDATATIGDVQKVISEYGLDPNDPEVLKTLLVENPTVALGKLAIARAKNPESTSAQNPPLSNGKSLTTETTPEELRKQYQKEVAGFRGNILKVSEIQARYRKLGLNI
jgi:hypothetical protein